MPLGCPVFAKSFGLLDDRLGYFFLFILWVAVFAEELFHDRPQFALTVSRSVQLIYTL